MATGLRQRSRLLPRLLGQRAGSAAVEFALVLTPFVLMVFGIFDFGRFLWTQSTLETAVETASHYVYAHAATDTLSSIQGAMAAQVQAAAVSLDPAQITVVTSTSTQNGYPYITINASYPFSFLGFLNLGGSTVSAQSTVPVL